MPFESEAQRKWMYANKPAMAKRWSKHTPKDKKLPEHVKKAELEIQSCFSKLSNVFFKVPKPVSSNHPR
jgi:hypothetical protein